MKKIFFIVFIISSTLSAQSHGTWTLTDSLNVPRWHAASVELANGNILISGGWGKTIPDSSAEIYDYKIGKWKQINPMVLGRALHKLVRLKNGNVLAIGGFGTKSCEIYDTNTKTWSLTDSLNYERSEGETATLLDNGNVLVVGGHYLTYGITKYLNSSEIYNVNTSKWTLTDSLGIAREGHSATKLQDGRVLIAGGNTKEGETKDSEIYNPKTGKWTEAAPLNIARYGHTATLLPDGKVLVTGGGDYSSTGLKKNSCELYDPVQNTWAIVDSLFVSRTDHSAILLKNGLLLIFGGYINNTTWELYNPNNFSNVYLGKYPNLQYNPLINLLPNGKVLSAGGTSIWTVDSLSGSLPVVYPARMSYLYDPNGIDNVGEQKSNTIKGFKVYQNYPNPFNPSTTIKYKLPITSHVVIKIYNSLGKEITILINKTQIPGTYAVNFNSKGLSSGVYFYQIIAGKWVHTNKMLLIK